ncbi:MAG: polysaccharide deacetylase family protein [Carboxylicivirga sp.]|jgi:polysaccharide deacetylase family protein (PEP-CTERM system associated)|nr:polysaccharide deacetylase family protein [Carboxylicivirga sp.]
MNILTFDIEEWYIYELHKKGDKSYYEPIIDMWLSKVLDLLDEHQLKATFFCLGTVARTHPEAIRKIADKGHELGCHSDIHYTLDRLSPAEFKEDTHRALRSIEDAVGQRVELYRAPAFSVTAETSWALEILVEQGIKYDSSIFPIKMRGKGFDENISEGPALIHTASGDIKEFPMSFGEVFGKRMVYSGGGFFRLNPYWLIKRLSKASHYNMTYFHLRDFDYKQKQIISLNYLKSYYGIRSAFAKFSKYLNDFDFISVGEAAKKIDWQNSWVLK